MIRWTAYYADDSQYESETTPWSSLPADGIVLVVQHHDPSDWLGKEERQFFYESQHYWVGVGPRGEFIAASNDPVADIRARYGDVVIHTGQRDRSRLAALLGMYNFTLEEVREMRNVTGWRVWYEDGLSFDSRTVTWASLPTDGYVIAKVYFGDGTSQNLNGYDYIFRAPTARGDVFGGSNGSLADILAQYPGAEVVRGKWTDAETMRLLMASALSVARP